MYINVGRGDGHWPVHLVRDILMHFLLHYAMELNLPAINPDPALKILKMRRRKNKYFIYLFDNKNNINVKVLQKTKQGRGSKFLNN